MSYDPRIDYFQDPTVTPTTKLCIKLASAVAVELDGAYSVDKARGRVKLRTLAEVAVDVLGWPLPVKDLEALVRDAARVAGPVPPTWSETRVDWLAEVAGAVELAAPGDQSLDS